MLFTEEELDKLDPPSARTMEILEFVKTEEVDPLYFDASYYATPEDAGKQAHHSSARGHGGVRARRNRQALHVRARVDRGDLSSRQRLTLHTMFYADEIRNVAEYGEKNGAEPKEQEKRLALQLIESLAPFEPTSIKTNTAPACAP